MTPIAKISCLFGIFLFLFCTVKIINQQFQTSVSNLHLTVTLKGHWHFENTDCHKTSLISALPTLDFENDSVAILGKYQKDGGMGGYHNPIGKTITFGGECFMADFKYTFEADQLRIISEGYDGACALKLASKCEPICCDKQAEFFYGKNIDIDLPILAKEKIIPFENTYLENSLFIGTPSEELKAIYGSDHRLVLGNNFATVEDLELWEEAHKVKIPASKRAKIFTVIYADKNTPMKVIRPLFEYFEHKKEKEIYFAIRKADLTHGLSVSWQRIDNYPMGDSTEVLSNWLKVHD